MDIMAKGCGESVCMNVLEALQDEHDVGLVTLSEPDFAELNDYFNTSVDLPALELATQLAPRLHRRYGIVYAVLQNALPSRYARRRAGAFGRLVSTIPEWACPSHPSSMAFSPRLVRGPRSRVLGAHLPPDGPGGGDRYAESAEASFEGVDIETGRS